ncbi:ABC transporter substrate-binding protein [Streptacidiphilus fuscans]|uniref:ABC transporter substrate-binding protein n=1 Tax=Streptacidiphilus fuscans TaxID=2789292 RepID=A0A931B988_9ACTN|nr:ABC transporter substrate-binding protein [Streptacidiphilus fuscans]MBF9069857.1 ABC transporter substrate-binding protein [Streptacidiphilus fuscans]MBF9073469.1 ABC transporter substrate-binding protein [Streptacidiphilus fuscans]
MAHSSVRPRPARHTRIVRAVSTATAALAAVAVVAGCSSTGSGSSSSADSSSSSSAGASTAAAAYPVTVSGANGKVTLASQPHHIVSLSPTATEDLYAVGAGKQVVAADSDSNYPSGVPTTSLSGLTPNIEAIAKYNPDLVITSQDAGGLVAGLTKLGVPVLIEPAAATINDVYTQIDAIGQATGHAAQATQTVTTMKASIAASVKAAGAHHPNLSYYWEVSANPYYSATSATFAGQIASLFGLKNIADKADKASDGGYPQLSAEYIVSAQPQLIFLTNNQSTDGGQTPAIVASRPGWSGIPAVKKDQIVGLNDDIASRWGPRLPQLVAQIAQAVEKAPAK